MSRGGTDSYCGVSGLPEIVQAAVALAREASFENSCRVEQGRLLYALAGGAEADIGETGTGCGVGVAWLVAGRRPGTRIISLEANERLAASSAALFADVDDVHIVHGDWTRIYEFAPFDLLVLDGGGNGKKTEPADARRTLRPSGTVVVDDLTPMTQWPPLHDCRPDEARMRWLEHPDLLASEIRLAPDLSTILGTRRPVAVELPESARPG